MNDPIKALVVDDSKSVRAYLCSFLENMDCSVSVATNGKEA